MPGNIWMWTTYTLPNKAFSIQAGNSGFVTDCIGVWHAIPRCTAAAECDSFSQCSCISQFVTDLPDNFTSAWRMLIWRKTGRPVLQSGIISRCHIVHSNPLGTRRQHVYNVAAPELPWQPVGKLFWLFSGCHSTSHFQFNNPVTYPLESSPSLHTHTCVHFISKLCNRGCLFQNRSWLFITVNEKCET